jgi:hypothetical protein
MLAWSGVAWSGVAWSGVQVHASTDVVELAVR